MLLMTSGFLKRDDKEAFRCGSQHENKACDWSTCSVTSLQTDASFGVCSSLGVSEPSLRAPGAPQPQGSASRLSKRGLPRTVATDSHPTDGARLRQILTVSVGPQTPS